MRATAEIVTLQSGRKAVMCTDREGRTDWPVRYQDGRVAFDYPERLPPSVWARASRLLARLTKEETL